MSTEKQSNTTGNKRRRISNDENWFASPLPDDIVDSLSASSIKSDDIRKAFIRAAKESSTMEHESVDRLNGHTLNDVTNQNATSALDGSLALASPPRPISPTSWRRIVYHGHQTIHKINPEDKWIVVEGQVPFPIVDDNRVVASLDAGSPSVAFSVIECFSLGGSTLPVVFVLPEGAICPSELTHRRGFGGCWTTPDGLINDEIREKWFKLTFISHVNRARISLQDIILTTADDHWPLSDSMMGMAKVNEVVIMKPSNGISSESTSFCVAIRAKKDIDLLLLCFGLTYLSPTQPIHYEHTLEIYMDVRLADIIKGLHQIVAAISNGSIQADRIIDDFVRERIPVPAGPSRSVLDREAILPPSTPSSPRDLSSPPRKAREVLDVYGCELAPESRGLHGAELVRAKDTAARRFHLSVGKHAQELEAGMFFSELSKESKEDTIQGSYVEAAVSGAEEGRHGLVDETHGISSARQRVTPTAEGPSYSWKEDLTLDATVQGLATDNITGSPSDESEKWTVYVPEREMSLEALFFDYSREGSPEVISLKRKRSLDEPDGVGDNEC